MNIGAQCFIPHFYLVDFVVHPFFLMAAKVVYALKSIQKKYVWVVL